MASAGERQRPARPPPPNVNGRLNTEEDTFSQLRRLHDQAFGFINEGLSLDERGQTWQAIDYYSQGLEQIEKAISLNPNVSPDQQEDVRKLLAKMTKSKLQIESRLENIRPSAPAENGACALMDTEDQPPSYEQATSCTDSFMELGDSLFGEEAATPANATEIYSIPEGVQIYFITPEGCVSAPSYPSSLKAYVFENNTEVASPLERPPAFLHVGEWVYPLVPGVSPVLHSSTGAYIFPDVNNPYPGSSIGLILPPSVSTEEKQRFEAMMNDLTALREQDQVVGEQPISDQKPRETDTEMGEEATEEDRAHAQARMAEKISRGILIAADWVSWGVSKGAEKAGEMIRRGSASLQGNMKPVEKPREIPQKYQKGAESVRKVTHAAVTVSGYVVSKLGQATVALGKQLAPHLRKQSKKFLPKSVTQKSADGNSKIDDFVEVASSGLKGFGTVYIGLETAARALAKGIATETVQVVNHKYGPEAAKFADNTLYSTGNLAMTGYNVNHLGVKAIAKRAVKDTGKAVLVDYKQEIEVAPGKPGAEKKATATEKPKIENPKPDPKQEKK